MQKRTSHTKSRKGCKNCKQRHVKCDEQGPPCFNCVSRSTGSSCSYAVSRSNLKSPAPSRQTTISPPGSELSTTSARPRLTRLVSTSSQSRRLLELRLMHRWSTTTYQSFCSTVYDTPWLQLYVPECALEHDYLLYGIFAISSLDLVIDGTLVDEIQRKMQYQAALEYYDKASASFRQQLSKITPVNFHSMYMFAFLAAAMYMARPLCPFEQRNQHQEEGVIRRAAVLMELLMACSGLAEQNAALMLDANGVSGSSVTTAISAVGDVCQSQVFLGSDTETALARLALLIETEAYLSISADPAGTPSSRKILCQNAVKWLRVSFGMEIKYGETVMGFCLAWPALAGKDFIEAFSKSDVLAMLILMHWAVLLDRLGSLAWWAYSMGKDLVQEISVLLSVKAQAAVVPEIFESIEWAKQQVGLIVGA